MAVPQTEASEFFRLSPGPFSVPGHRVWWKTCHDGCELQKKKKKKCTHKAVNKAVLAARRNLAGGDCGLLAGGLAGEKTRFRTELVGFLAPILALVCGVGPRLRLVARVWCYAIARVWCYAIARIWCYAMRSSTSSGSTARDFLPSD
eukprot:3534931-Rhodomonas_salina.1